MEVTEQCILLQKAFQTIWRKLTIDRGSTNILCAIAVGEMF